MSELNSLVDPHAEKRGDIFHRANMYAPGVDTVQVEKPLALTNENTVVPLDHVDAAYLLVGENGTLPADLAGELGVKGKSKEQVEKDTPEADKPAKSGLTVETQQPRLS